MNYHDIYGWLSLTPIPDRAVDAEPPAHDAAPVVCHPWPNWTGYAWIMLNYAEPSPPPPPSPQPKPLSVLAFRSRFTDAEKIAIYTAAEASIPIRVWLDDLNAAQNQTVDLIDPRIVAGVHAMEYGGLIGAGRAAEILA